MKYYKRLNEWKASNVKFNPELVEAHSYDWWKFVAKINGYIVFNNYSYSMSTHRHQSKVRRLLEQLNIPIDLVIYTRKSIGAIDFEKDALKQAYQTQNKDRIKKIKKVFKVKFTNEEIQNIYNEVEESMCDAYLSRAFEYSEKKREEKTRLELHDKAFSKKVTEVINAQQ